MFSTDGSIQNLDRLAQIKVTAHKEIYKIRDMRIMS